MFGILGGIITSARHFGVCQDNPLFLSMWDASNLTAYFWVSVALYDGERSSLQGLVPSDDMVNSESVVDIKPGESGVEIGYQVDDFTCTWSG